MEIIKPIILFHYSIPKDYLLHKKTIIDLNNTGNFTLKISIDINNVKQLLFYLSEAKILKIKFIYNIIFFSSFIRFVNKNIINISNFLNKKNINFFYKLLYLTECLRFNSLKKKARKIIYLNKPKIVFLTVDRTPGIESSLIYYSKILNINVVCLQSIFINTAGLINNRKKSYHHLNLEKKLNINFDEGQLWIYKNNKYNFYFYPTYLALKKLNILPHNPWLWGSNSEYIFTDSIISKKNLEIYLPNKNIVNTGNSTTDELIEVIKDSNEIKKFEYELLISLPHLSEHKYCSYEEHIDQLKKIFRELEKINLKICLSLHPRSSYKIVQFVKNNIFNNFELLNDNPKFGNMQIIKAIASCSFFLSWRSTSIHYSTLVGKKTFVMDWYDLPNYGNEIIEDKLIKINNINSLSSVINSYDIKNFKNEKNIYLNNTSSINLINKELVSILEKRQ